MVAQLLEVLAGSLGLRGGVLALLRLLLTAILLGALLLSTLGGSDGFALGTLCLTLGLALDFLGAGWLVRLRAAVLGANDGIVSVSALIVGVAAADPSPQAKERAKWARARLETLKNRD